MLALLGSDDESTAGRLDKLDLNSELKADAVPLVQAAGKIADDWRHGPVHEPRGQLKASGRGAELGGRACNLEPDETAADQHDRAARLKLWADARGVVEAAEIMHGQVVEC